MCPVVFKYYLNSWYAVVYGYVAVVDRVRKSTGIMGLQHRHVDRYSRNYRYSTSHLNNVFYVTTLTRFVYSRLTKLITVACSKTVLICSDASGSEVCVISMLGSEKYAADHGVFKLDHKVCEKAELDFIRMNMLVDFLYGVRLLRLSG